MTRTSLILCLASALSAWAQTLDLTGRVLDKADNRPVPGAMVKALNTSLSATTDSAGRFAIKGMNTAVRGGGRAWVAAPRIRDGALHVQAVEDAEARIQVYDLGGESLGSVRSILRAGWNRVRLPVPKKDFMGAARVTLGGESWVLPILRVAGHVQSLEQAGSLSAGIASAGSGRQGAAPARKQAASAAAGQVEISMPGLMTRTAPYAADTQDLGDIVMDYPARKLGLGAPPVYGAYVLFDGAKGRAAAQAELKEKWKDWIPGVTGAELDKYTAALEQFKIAKDPEFPNDTTRVTLQSCCNKLWGYDDIQARAVHGDAQIHVEWIGMGQYDETEDPNANVSAASGQPGYINSGVYIQSRYEIQIESPGVSDAKHTMASIVDDWAAVGAAAWQGNGKWQAYDITFRTARYDGSTRTAYAFTSVWWNGTLIHNNRETHGTAAGTANHSGEELTPVLHGLKLQSEGRDVRFRNIWVKPLEIPTAETAFGY